MRVIVLAFEQRLELLGGLLKFAKLCKKLKNVYRVHSGHTHKQRLIYDLFNYLILAPMRSCGSA